MATDLEIAKRVALKEVEEIAREAGIPREYIEPYGRYKGKVSLDLFDKLEKKPDGKLVLVTAITPTPAGEGKTTVSIGLSLAFNRIGKRCGVALREPSMGPLFGIKGGAAGGGWSQVLPMEEINLHFTGDIHAVSAAHNLLGAVIDNHLFRRKEPPLDPRRIGWPRVMDMNDRALRNVILGLGGKENGVPGGEAPSPPPRRSWPSSASPETTKSSGETLQHLCGRNLWERTGLCQRPQGSGCHGCGSQGRPETEHRPDHREHSRLRSRGTLCQHRPGGQLGPGDPVEHEALRCDRHRGGTAVIWARRSSSTSSPVTAVSPLPRWSSSRRYGP